MAEPEVDARAALQALFAATRPKTPQGSNIFDEAADGESAAQRAGVALRHLFRGEMQKAVHPPAAAERLKEIEAQVGKLLDQVSPSAKFKPPARPRTTLKSKSGVDMEVQTVLMHVPIPRDIKDPVMPEPIPDLDAGRARPTLCKIPDKSENGLAMRQKCNDARKLILELDNEVTAAKAQLTVMRKKHWERQRYKCAKDREVETVFAANAHKLPSNGAAHSQEELAKHQSELCSAKQEAAQWSKRARRLDAELQQQFRGVSEVQKILLRHPAGEVFLPPMGGDNDSDAGSDDEYYRRGDVQLASSDEEHSPPPPPSQQWRPTNVDPDESASEASSMTSPSGESCGLPSPTGESAPRHRLAAGPSVQKPGSDTESSDEDNVAPKRKSPTGEQSKPVPPLPGLAALNGSDKPAAAPPGAAAATAKAGAGLNDPEEVSSEDIYSQDADDNESSQSV